MRSGLEDGAYAEFTDVDLKWKSPDNTLAGSAGEKVNQIFIDSCQNILRKEPSPGKYLEKWATDAGFEDIHIKSYVMPFGTWPADKKLVSRWPPFVQSVLANTCSRHDTTSLVH